MRLQGLRQLAKGKPCMARTQWCNGNPETTVLCHLADQWAGRGFAHKSHDLLAFLGCHACHDVIDGRAHINETTREERRQWGYEAVCRTLAYFLDNERLDIKVKAA